MPDRWYHVGPILALADPGLGGAPTGPGAATASRADVYVFDEIGSWSGVTADDFVRDVAGLDVDEIVLHLNSPGGEVAEGTAIANVLRAHRASVVVRVDGIAASSASVIAMAGDEIVMGVGSQMMIHEARGGCMGRAQDMREYAQALESATESIAATYAARAGGTAAEWRAAMATETWYTAEEAVAAGLADRVAALDETGTATGEQVTPGRGGLRLWDLWDQLGAVGRHDLSGFRFAGRAAAPAPAMPGGTHTSAPAGAAEGNNKGRGEPMAFTDAQLDTMRRSLGLAEDADEQTITDALSEALEERADGGQGGGAPAGTVIVDAAQWEATRAAAQRGADAASRQEQDDRERLVDAAIGDGRIAPASRAHWLTQLEHGGQGAVDTLASLQKGLIPVGKALGYSGEPVEGGAEQRMQKGRDLYGRRHGKA